jgi:hypothetical protein
LLGLTIPGVIIVKLFSIFDWRFVELSLSVWPWQVF